MISPRNISSHANWSTKSNCSPKRSLSKCAAVILNGHGSLSPPGVKISRERTWGGILLPRDCVRRKQASLFTQGKGDRACNFSPLDRLGWRGRIELQSPGSPLAVSSFVWHNTIHSWEYQSQTLMHELRHLETHSKGQSR